jgi:hypothetical protein
MRVGYPYTWLMKGLARVPLTVPFQPIAISLWANRNIQNCILAFE